jgi:Nitrous oxide-stimulated promoter
MVNFLSIMLSLFNRLDRERRTIRAMIEIYCRAHHRPPDNPCPQCQQLAEYALLRIERCPFKPDKPTCASCTIHCCKPAMREQVRVVMRYAGPRMLLAHPFLAIAHLIDGATRHAGPDRSRKVSGAKKS